MTRTITALFNDRAEAITAVDELVAAGISKDMIRTTPDVNSPSMASGTNYDTGRDDRGFWASLKDLFVPDEDSHVYAEAMHRGNIMVAATVDDRLAHQAEDILERQGTVDIAEQEATWRKDGWTGTHGAVATGAATGAVAADAGTENLQIVEERLQVGKRQVDSGRVKIRSYVVETPVSEQVNLRRESVHVDEVAVDRALRPGEDPFRERTIEATATSEEAVIAKEARVTGEVRVVKTANDRVETVTDTVRSTKVDVDGGLTTADTVDTIPRKR